MADQPHIGNATMTVALYVADSEQGSKEEALGRPGVVFNTCVSSPPSACHPTGTGQKGRPHLTNLRAVEMRYFILNIYSSVSDRISCITASPPYEPEWIMGPCAEPRIE